MADRPLHIGVDGRELLGQTTGVGRYVAEVLRCWARDTSWPHRITIFLPAPPPPGLDFGSRVSWQIDPGTRPGTWWEQRRLPGLLRQAGVDVLLAPAYTAPVIRACPFVVVIHDVSFFAHPEWFTPRDGLRRRLFTRWAAHHAARVLTVSEFSAGEIIRHLGVARDRIALAPPAGPRPRSPHVGRPRPGSLVLYAGSLFNRRRIPLLIEGFALAARQAPDARLVLVGDNRTTPPIDPVQLAARTGLADRIRWDSYVDGAALETLYESATVFAFLSEYEGFGIPPMEALAHGVPPVLLDTPVSREIYGTAATLVAPTPESIASGLLTLLSDPGARQAKVAAGQNLFSRFTWERTAQAARAALEAAVP